MNKWDIILSRVESKYWSRTHKYEILFPKYIAEVKKISEDNNNMLWMYVVQLEMNNIMFTFEEYEGGLIDMVGC